MKSILIHFWPRQLKADHLHEFNFSHFTKIWKTKAANQISFSHFLVVWVMDVLRTIYLARTGKPGARSPSRSLARSTRFLRQSRL